MKFINKTKILSFLPQIVAMLFLAGFVVYAWTEPSQAPPGGNVSSPINVGTTTQYKAGALGIGGVLRGYADAIFDAKVGIGTTNPQGLLDVGGGKFVVTSRASFQPSSGVRDPGSAVSNARGLPGLFPWTDPLSVTAKDFSYAFSWTPGVSGGASAYLEATNFGFNLPPGSQIDGIEVKIDKVMGGDGLVTDIYVGLIKNGTLVGENKALPSDNLWAGERYYTYGGPTDKWGVSWDTSSINNLNFGVALRASMDGRVGVGGLRAGVDHMTINVYYGVPSSVDIIKVGNNEMVGDTTISPSLNADKLDNLNANDIMKGALFGTVGAETAVQFYTGYPCNCKFSTPPAYCTMTKSWYCSIGCEPGYTLVKTALGTYPSGAYISFWSCQKN